jgi:general secretion pathway protein L
MRLGELLDADLAVLGPKLIEAARAGFDWWVGELQGMAPAGLRTWSAGGGRPVAERAVDGDYVLVGRDGRPRRYAPARVAVRAALRLPVEAVLTLSVQAPPLPERDLRRMMVLDIDRLTPFRAEEVYLDVVAEPSPSAGASGARPVLVGVTPRAIADAALADARAVGLEPSALIAAGEAGQTLDFLPAMRRAGALGPGRRTAKLWWAVVAVLLAANVGGGVWRDCRGLAELQAAVAAQRPQVQRVAALRASLLAEAQRRRVLAAALADDEPLRALDAASRALPDAAWVQRAAFTATSIRLAGFHPPGLDVVAALRRDPRFTQVQSASSDAGVVSQAGALSSDPFDVSADLVAAAPVR